MNNQILDGLLITFIVPILIGFIIFIFIIRAIFSIGKIVSLLEKIEKNTSKTPHSNTGKIEQPNQQDLPNKDYRTSLLDPRMNWK
jgi:hypothetical protein